MKPGQPIDLVARDLEADVQTAVFNASRLKTDARDQAMARDFPHLDALRRAAGAVRQHTLDHLPTYLEQTESALIANGARVHWAADADAACRRILDILQDHGARRMVKAKSMISEEIELNPFLERHGIEVTETDLGEFIVQLDGDRPSHIVTPILHKNRRASALCFERNGLGAYNDDPEVITRRARAHLRKKFLEADAGLTGANLVSAESGRVLVVTNEGNGRFCAAAPRLHIVLAGIEKIVPDDRDFPLFLALLVRTATAQRLTSYTQFIAGPRRETQDSGPEEMHVVFLDNGRSAGLASPQRAILRCIRCGGCLNVCPVYRQAGGHAYRGVYPGPIGSVLTPLLQPDRFPEWADLPKASTLCGACEEICPVNIPIPDLLLQLRARGHREKAPEALRQTPSFRAWSFAATRPALWAALLRAGRLLNAMPRTLLRLYPAAHRWQQSRDLPPVRGGAFRRWMKQRTRRPGGDDRT